MHLHLGRGGAQHVASSSAEQRLHGQPVNVPSPPFPPPPAKPSPPKPRVSSIPSSLHPQTCPSSPLLPSRVSPLLPFRHLQSCPSRPLPEALCPPSCPPFHPHTCPPNPLLPSPVSALCPARPPAHVPSKPSPSKLCVRPFSRPCALKACPSHLSHLRCASRLPPSPVSSFFPSLHPQLCALQAHARLSCYPATYSGYLGWEGGFH